MNTFEEESVRRSAITSAQYCQHHLDVLAKLLKDRKVIASALLNNPNDKNVNEAYNISSKAVLRVLGLEYLLVCK